MAFYRSSHCAYRGRRREPDDSHAAFADRCYACGKRRDRIGIRVFGQVHLDARVFGAKAGELPGSGFLIVGGLPGVIAGSLLLDNVQKGARPDLLYVAIGGLITATAIFHLWRMFQPRPESSLRDRAKYLPFFAGPIGLEVGFSSAGAGALGSLLLLGMTRLTAAEVVGTDLCFGVCPGIGWELVSVDVGNYDPHLLTLLSIGGVAGAVVGATLAGKIAQKPLRVALLLALILIGGQLCWRGIDRMGAAHAVSPQAAILSVHATQH